MSFPGKDKMSKDAPVGGKWIKLVDDMPLRVTILSYVGTTVSKKFPDKTQYRFEAMHNGGGTKNLDCNWRLMKALTEQVNQLDSAFEVTITQRKVIAEIEAPDGSKKKQLVNEYTLEGVKAVDASGEITPF